MPGKKYECNGCKKIMRSDNLKKHKKICKKNQETTSIQTSNKEDIVSDILDKVTERANMGVEPMTIHPKNRIVPAPKSSDIEMNSDSETDLDPGSESENESTDSSISDDPEDLKMYFRKLFYKLHRNIDHNIELYNKLVFMLNEMETMNCLTEEECNAMNECLRNKMRI